MILILVLAFLTVTPAHAAINYGGQSYSATIATSTSEQVSGLIKDFSINDINSSESISAGIGLFAGIKNFFVGIDSWLKVNAGINFFGILTTIGHWFIIVLEWILAALKAIL